VPRLARQAARLLDALGLPEADVLGVSFGGAVAQQLALDNPKRVGRLVLASTSVGLGGVRGHPLALALLATPLRYYSPSFFAAPRGSFTGRSTRRATPSCCERR
jgi:pimeloyl-ACP methyl ester carboxylesterase